MDEVEAGRLVLAERRHDRRIRVFSALLATESGLGTTGMTVVGGSAIEIYTEGDYVSDDLDVLVDRRANATDVLRRWGFTDRGKLFTRDDWKIYVDLMERENSGSRRLTRILRTRNGAFRVSGPEDLILKRVRELVNWKDRGEAYSQASLIVERFGNDLDWEYIDCHAKKEGFENVIARLRGTGEPGNGAPPG